MTELTEPSFVSPMLATLVDDVPGCDALRFCLHRNGGDAPTNADIHWVTPQLVCEVGFTEWTSARRLWHPRFIDFVTTRMRDRSFVRRCRSSIGAEAGSMEREHRTVDDDRGRARTDRSQVTPS